MAESFNASLNVNLNPASLNASTKQVSQALGRITGQASEFQKSLDASTARVFAFGATTLVLNGVTQSFKKLIAVTVEVEKRLVEINSIFQATESTFNRFRNSIFQVAKDTGQAFNTVAEGAAELARQGLSAEETATRLKAALILTRISGLDAEKSVKALTAAINGFTSAGLNANQIVNKMVAVDTAFAVSAQDLAEAFSRAGSTAEDAGVSFNELLGLVTAVEQKTARGGAVIGNAFKSIFTRLQRGTTIEELKSLGVQIDATQSGVQKLHALSNAIENIADPTVISKIKELAGGVFQINVVSAALKDLGNDTSIFKNAAITAASATNEAFEKNAALNKTISAQINSLVQGLTSLAERVGSITFGPLIENLVGIASKFTEFLDKALDPEKGNVFIKGFFKAIGSFLSGPAVIIFTAAFVKISQLIAKFAAEGLKSLFVMGTQAEKIKQVEAGIVGLLSRDASLRKIITSTTATQAQKEQAIMAAIRTENSLLAQQAAIMRSLAAATAARGVSFGGGGFKTGGRRGMGFAGGFQQEEATAKMMGAKNPKARRTNAQINGRNQSVIVNSEEDVFHNVGRNGDSAIIPRYSRGFVPNYANFRLGGRGEAFSGAAMARMNLSSREKAKYTNAAGVGYKKGSKKRAAITNAIYDANKPIQSIMLVPQKMAYSPTGANMNFQKDRQQRTGFKGFAGAVAGIDPNLKKNSPFGRLMNLDKILDASLARGVNSALAVTLAKSGGELKAVPKKFTSKQIKSTLLKEGGAGAFGALRGAVFESIINAITGGVKSGTGNNTLDVKMNSSVAQIFGVQGKGYKWGDFKNSMGQKSKFASQVMRSLPRKPSAAGGFIPNYARGGGVPSSQVRVHLDKERNPFAVTNTGDERPNSLAENAALQDAIGREKKGIGMFASGFVPNYAGDEMLVKVGGKWVPASGSFGGGSSAPSSGGSSSGGSKGGGAGGLMFGLMALQTALMTLSAHGEQSSNAIEAEIDARNDHIKATVKDFGERRKALAANQKELAETTKNTGFLQKLGHAASVATTSLIALGTLNMLTGGMLGKGGMAMMGLGKTGKAAWKTSGAAYTAARAGGAGRMAAAGDSFFGRGAKGSGFGGKFGKFGGRAMGVGTKALGKLGVVGALGVGAYDIGSTMLNKDLNKEQKTERVGKSGSTLAGGLAGAAIGQAVIPIPVVGALIGGIVGAGLAAWGGEKAFGSDADANRASDEKLDKAQTNQEALIGFKGQNEFDKATTKNLAKVVEEGGDQEAIITRYRNALKKREETLNEVVTGEENSIELQDRLNKSLGELEKASMVMTGSRFKLAEDRADHFKRTVEAEDALSAATIKLSTERNKLILGTKRALDRAKSDEETGKMRVGLKTAIDDTHGMAGLVGIASENNLEKRNINTLDAELKKAAGELADKQAQGLKGDDLKEFVDAVDDAGKSFKDAVKKSGTRLMVEAKKIADLQATNATKINEAESKSRQLGLAFSEKVVTGKVSGDTNSFMPQVKALEEIKKRIDRDMRSGGRTEMTQEEMREVTQAQINLINGFKEFGLIGQKAIQDMLEALLRPDTSKWLDDTSRDRAQASMSGKEAVTPEIIEILTDRIMDQDSIDKLKEEQGKLAHMMTLNTQAFAELEKDTRSADIVGKLKKLKAQMDAAAQSFEGVQEFVGDINKVSEDTAKLVKSNATFVVDQKALIKAAVDEVARLKARLDAINVEGEPVS